LEFRDRPLQGWRSRRGTGGRGCLTTAVKGVLGLLLIGLFICSAFAQGIDARAQFSITAAEGRARLAQREQWFLRGRGTPGNSAAQQRYQAYLQKKQTRGGKTSQAAPPIPSGAVWSALGPAPLASDASGIGEFDYNWVSGRATSVVIDPADPTGNTVYIGGAYGGVWKSTNAGPGSPNPASVVWQPITDDQPTLAVGAIAIQPGNNNPNNSLVLVGTGEANSSADSYYGLGILRSPDAGNTWTLIPTDSTGTRSFAGMAFSKIAFSSTVTNLAVAATAGASEGIIEGLANPITANLGLYYSLDSGGSWAYANVSDGGVGTAPGSATSVAYNASAGQFFAALRYHGFYSSADGVNWTRLVNQPGPGLSTTACPANPGTTGCPIYRGELAIVPGRNEMYVWYVDVNDFDQGIWKSMDGGVTWLELADVGITICGDPFGCGTEQGSYDLELAAVPNGSSGITDLYAGTINLYKCEITNASPNCSGTGDNSFLNLTHVYGCPPDFGSIAKVHPAQHAVSFQLVNGNNQVVMYFANDGGIYRALDGYGLLTGTCGGHNPFDSLNQTLGSMTQFVSFAQAANDANTIIGGTQGNGSPATQSALTNPQWSNLNVGDGGHVQINPGNEDEWFISSPPDALSGVNVFRCASGIGCHSQDFQNDQVVSSATVGGDSGAYDPPYLLDPQSSGELILGTCRMWRGNSMGNGFSVLSHSFETGGDGICTGSEINLVRSAAAGGALDANGFSNVIYAGTDGFGPLVPTSPPGGHVWVSTDVAGGASTWVDQTGAINPNNFPISGIAIDSSDTQGLTAYVGVMGFSTVSFPTSHLWKTSDGGGSWTNFTADLPNAPVNAVLVDPGSVPTNGTVYVGTDVGVFASSSGSASWTEVGPAPGSGPGYLPNVAVTALGMFNDTIGNKWLRASTYGRGVWQFPLVTVADFFLSVANTPQTVYAGQEPALFNGKAFALGGYGLPVSLTCVPGATNPPRTCALPNNVVPTTAGASFQLSASDVPQDYSFAVQGTDQHNLMHQAPVTLKVVDFGLTPPSPGSLMMGPGSNSPPVSFQVTAAGSFQDTVNLSCVVPQQLAGLTCNFQPSSMVNPTAGNPVAVTLTLTTTAHQVSGTGSIIIKGAVANGYNKTQNLIVTVIKDYSLAIVNPTLQANVNAAPVDYDGTLTSLNNYNSPANLSCGAGATEPPPTCSASPTPLVPTANGAPFTVAVASNQCSPPNTPPHTPFRFNILAQGTDSSKTSHSVPVTFTATSNSQDDFTLDVVPSSNTAAVNTPTIFNGTLTGTVCYYYPVHLSCGSDAPPTCQFSPATLNPSVGGIPFILTVSSDTSQVYNFEITAVGSDPNATTHSFLASFTSTGKGQPPRFSFTVTSSPSTQSVAAGQSASYGLDVKPSMGVFPAAVVLSVSGCPPLSTCSLSPTQVSKGDAETHVALVIQTTAPVITDKQSALRLNLPIYSLWLPLPGLIFALGGPRRRQSRRFVALCWLVLALATGAIEISCGGGLVGNGSAGNAEPGTPPNIYPVTVTATMPSQAAQTTNVDLTVN